MAPLDGRMRSSHDVAADIRRKIDSGEWADGFRVPPERELAATYRLARNTVRRALQELDGSLVRVVGRGTFVRGNAGARPREFLGRLRDASPTLCAAILSALRAWLPLEQASATAPASRPAT